MQFPSSLDHKPGLTRPAAGRKRPGPASRRPASCRLFVEALEDRCLLSFSPIVSYPVGTNPQAIVTGYFNDIVGDVVPDNLDLAVVNYADWTVSLLLGNADGTFQPAVTSATGAYPLSLAVGDFNDDGNLDLATANLYDASVMLGNGDGTFQAPSSMGVLGNPQSVAVGDFDGDGLLDLGVTSNVYNPGFYSGYYPYYYWNPGYTTSYANVLLGNGDGSFSGPNSTFLDYVSHNSALAADLNGDVYEDFVTFHPYGYVSVLLGDSSGFLQGPSLYFTGDYSYAVAAGDLDGDFDADLVTANYYGSSVGVLLGDGLGGFSGPNNYATGNNPTSIVLGEFTGDTKLDAATANYSGQQVSVLYGGGDGAFSTPLHSTLGTNPWAITAGDFNGDTWLDAATVNPGDNNVSVLINDQSWPPPPATLSISDVTVTEGDSGAVEAVFTVTRRGNLGATVTVDFSTADGDALAGSDYQNTFGTLTFGADVTELTITVPILGDFTHESDEYYYVNLTAPVGANITDGQGVGSIVDNDPPPTLSIDDVTVTEGDSGTVEAVFTVTRDGNLDSPVTVNFSTGDGGALAGSDYIATNGTLAFEPGDTSKTITVLVKGDVTDEYDQAFYVYLWDASGAEIIDSQGEGMIADNDAAPTITITAKVSAKEGKNNALTPFDFIVTLSAPSEKEVSVNFATANGTARTADNDYIANSGTLVFAPGATSRTIRVQVRGDKRKESNETFFVNLTGATNATIVAAQGLGEILDDDASPGKGRP